MTILEEVAVVRRASRDGSFGRDTAEHRRFEQTHQEVVGLEPASLANDRFLAIISHEMRAPLNRIMGLADLLLLRLPGPLNREQEDDIQAIQASAEHVLSLVEDLHDLANIESGKVEVNREAFDCRCEETGRVLGTRPVS